MQADGEEWELEYRGLPGLQYISRRSPVKITFSCFTILVLPVQSYLPSSPCLRRVVTAEYLFRMFQH